MYSILYAGSQRLIKTFQNNNKKMEYAGSQRVIKIFEYNDKTLKRLGNVCNLAKSSLLRLKLAWTKCNITGL